MQPDSRKTRRLVLGTLVAIVFMPILFSMLLTSCRSVLAGDQGARAACVVDQVCIDEAVQVPLDVTSSGPTQAARSSHVN